MSANTKQNIVKKDGVWTVDGRPRETLKMIGQQQPSNIPGMSQITILITLPPGGATPPHRHGGAAVTGLMLKGSSINQMNDDPAKTYKEGETWFESPGCHHSRSENVGETEAAFYAIIIVDTKVAEKGLEALVVLDADVEEQRNKGANGSA